MDKDKFYIGDIVKFKHIDEIYEGEIVGLSESSTMTTLCIYVESLSDSNIGYEIEHKDLKNMTSISDKIEKLIGKNAFWKNRTSIISKKESGSKCIKCKTYNKYINDQNYKCWSCTNYPY